MTHEFIAVYDEPAAEMPNYRLTPCLCDALVKAVRIFGRHSPVVLAHVSGRTV